jgi:hypothetical protein
LKLIVFPEARRAQVEAALADLRHRGGTENLTLTITRLYATGGWSVYATGLGDPVMERGLCDVGRRC